MADYILEVSSDLDLAVDDGAGTATLSIPAVFTASTLNERVAGEGLTIDGVLLKDGSVQATGFVDADGYITTQSFYAIASGSPGIYFRDTDANPAIDHAGLLATAAATTLDHEYIDVEIRQLVDGVLTTAMTFKSDGDISLDLNRSFKSGPAIQKMSASITPANNGELVVEATSNTQLTFKYKGSDSTVRTGTITLS